MEATLKQYLRRPKTRRELKAALGHPETLRRFLQSNRTNISEIDMLGEPLYFQRNWLTDLGKKATISDIFLNMCIVMSNWHNLFKNAPDTTENLLEAADRLDRIVTEASRRAQLFRDKADELQTHEIEEAEATD